MQHESAISTFDVYALEISKWSSTSRTFTFNEYKWEAKKSFITQRVQMGGLEILSMSRKVTFNVFKWEASHMYTLLFLSKSLVWVDKLLSTCSNGRPPICIRSRNLQAMNHESVISTFGVYALEISTRCSTSRSSPRSAYTRWEASKSLSMSRKVIFTFFRSAYTDCRPSNTLAVLRHTNERLFKCLRISPKSIQRAY